MSVTTPLDLISKSLSDIGALAAGESIESNIANDAFETLNDLLDQWSNEKMMLPCVQEVIHELASGKYVYSIGAGGDMGATFTGSVSGTLLTVTAITTGAISVGQLITSGTGITANSVITSYQSGTGGGGSGALGTYQLSLPSTATGSISIATSVVRPLRINSGFVRVVSSVTGTLDYPIAPITSEEYELIGIKTLSGPWPRAFYYQPSLPLGIVNYWPSPSSGEIHLFCDMQMNRFQSLSETMVLQPGAIMALRWNLGELLLPSYGRNDQMLVQLVQKFAAQGRMYLKRTNMQPQQASKFDPVLGGTRVRDAGWILSGGFS